MASSCRHHTHFRRGCADCQAMASAYQRRRDREVCAGTWLPKQPADLVVAHIRELRAAGMAIADIALAAGLSERTVRPVATGQRHWVLGPTAAAILGVVATPPTPRPPAGFVPNVGTVRRIRALVAEGYGFAEQGRRLGIAKEIIWYWAWERGGATYIAETNAQDVATLYDQLVAVPPPVGQYATRARREAVKRGWHDHWAWPDDRIDDPAAEPYLGDDPVDEVKVERALAGQPVELAGLEAAVALRRGLEAGLAKTTLQTQLHIGTAKANRLLADYDVALAT